MKKMVLLVLLSSILVGCSLLFDVVRKQFTVSLNPQELTLARGESGEISVTITPLTGVDLSLDEAEVKLINPPNGVTADPLIIPGNIRERTLTLRVTSTATLAEKKTITVEVKKGQVANDAKFKLSITP